MFCRCSSLTVRFIRSRRTSREPARRALFMGESARPGESEPLRTDLALSAPLSRDRGLAGETSERRALGGGELVLRGGDCQGRGELQRLESA